jgi:ABC-2 type transport system permease protein
MTATIEATTAGPAAPVAAPALDRPGLLRLTGVELRKMADTRAGFWLLVTTAVVTVGVVAVQLIFSEPADQNFFTMFQTTLLPTGILLPILGILSVTSEWTQRTALTTFALVPHRGRVALAKTLAVTVLGVASIVAGLAAAAAGNLVAGALDDAAGSWAITGGAIGYATLFNFLNVMTGLAFGMLLMNSAVAIVLYFVAPTVWAILGGLISALEKPMEWLDTTRTFTPLVEDAMTSGAWARLGTSVALWIVLPFVAGLFRLLHREVA